MSNADKTMIAVPFFGIWGFYLLYLWLNPASVPEWARFARHALFLSRGDLEPTPFTLGFGILFVIFTGMAMWRVATDNYRED